MPEVAVNINICDTSQKSNDVFCPLRLPGPYLPRVNEVSALSLFKLFFNDSILDRIVRSTYAYAEAKKDSKKSRYKLFMKKKFDKIQLMAFLGALILLGIHNVRNHRKAWSTSKAQVIYRLRDLLTCQQFELIGAFLHVVTPTEELEASCKPLRKLQPLIDHIKYQNVELYQPRKELSVDERMVKSKARCHFIQYMRNKPVKWGFKLWILADMSGYTMDFNIYTGKSVDRSDLGLSYDVVPYCFQGYEVYVDNFYSSPTLFDSLLKLGITATGTFRTNRKEIPKDVIALKMH